MREARLLSLIVLLVIVSASGANDDASLRPSEYCFPNNATCGLQSLNCTDREGRTIMILGEERGFGLTTMPQTCQSNVCSQACCTGNNFGCFRPVSNISFRHAFSSCWNKSSCSFLPTSDSQPFEANSPCRNHTQYSIMRYGCIAKSSVLDFWDPSEVTGTLLAASFNSSTWKTAGCNDSNVTMECLVESIEQQPVYVDRITLVMRHSLQGPCSSLTFSVLGYTSPRMACGSTIEYFSHQNVLPPITLTLSLRDTSSTREAWAVVARSGSLKMTCGKTTCSRNSGSTDKTSASILTSTQHTATSTTARGVNTPSSSSSSGRDERSTSNSSIYTTRHPTDTKKPVPVAAIAGGVVAGLVVIAVIVVVAVIFCRRMSSRGLKSGEEGEEKNVAVKARTKDLPLKSQHEPDNEHEDRGTPERTVADVYAVPKKKPKQNVRTDSGTHSVPNISSSTSAVGTEYSPDANAVYSVPFKPGKKHRGRNKEKTMDTRPPATEAPSSRRRPGLPPKPNTKTSRTLTRDYDDASDDYDHLGKKRQLEQRSSDVTYDVAEIAVAEDATEYSYDHLKGAGRSTKGNPKPGKPGSGPYGSLGMVVEGDEDEED